VEAVGSTAAGVAVPEEAEAASMAGVLAGATAIAGQRALLAAARTARVDIQAHGRMLDRHIVVARAAMAIVVGARMEAPRIEAQRLGAAPMAESTAAGVRRTQARAASRMAGRVHRARVARLRMANGTPSAALAGAHQRQMGQMERIVLPMAELLGASEEFTMRVRQLPTGSGTPLAAAAAAVNLLGGLHPGQGWDRV